MTQHPAAPPVHITYLNRLDIEALALTCPVCEYNLGRRQSDIRASQEGLNEVPTFYFTQLLALALDLPSDKLGLNLNEKAAVSERRP